MDVIVTRVVGLILAFVLVVAVLVGAIGYALKPAQPIYINSHPGHDYPSVPNCPPLPNYRPTPNEPWIPNPSYNPRPGSQGSQGSLGSKDVGAKGAKETK